MINDIKVIKSHEPTNLAAIEKFEKFIDAKLPEDYKHFLLKHNGGHPLADTYKLSKPINQKNLEIGVSWFFALYDDEVCNITLEFQRSRDALPDEFLPIAYDSGGKLCLIIRGDNYGQLYYWTTNWSCWNDNELNGFYYVSDNFSNFINGLYESVLDDDYNIIRRYQDGTVTVSPLKTKM